MIHGIGTDICDISRVAETWRKFGTRFEEKLLHANDWRPEKVDAHYLAKRWAAKEAVAKALGTAISGNVTLQDIYITKTAQGKPEAHLSARVAATIGSGYRLHLSLSDEKNHAIAFAILELAD